MNFSSDTIDGTVRQHAPLIRRMAFRVLRGLPANVHLDDLVQAGMLGLMESLRSYRGEMSASFRTYASYRVRGAMLDEIRRHDWVSRSVCRDEKTFRDVSGSLERQTDGAATSGQIADALGIGIDEYHARLRRVVGDRISTFSDLEDSVETDPCDVQDPSADPVGDYETSCRQETLDRALCSLKKNQRVVLSLYYGQGLKLREIGDLLGLTEGRIQQIRAQAISRLRARIEFSSRPSGPVQ